VDLINYSDRVFGVDGFLSQVECEQLVAEAESHGFETATVRTASGPKLLQNIRNNERVIFESPAWVAQLWQRLETIKLPELDGKVARALPKDLRFYKYVVNQRFKMHKDGGWTEAGMSSKLTFMIYLNDGFVGGETDFREFKVTPKTGSALLFVHDTWHEGAAIIEGIKYVLRSDVLYGDPLK
jgi:hypothetical protein